ncbi:MAG: IS1595 family transposase [Acidobacteriia bacterium]|nr:IS1595 family transposase [Terriglobia bacterium]
MQPTNLVSVVEQYATDDRCRETLTHLRWPKGVECPRCHNKGISRAYDRNVFDCNSCRHQFSVTAGTMFHDSHLPLTKWFLVTYLMCESRKGISANQIKRMLGISYKTAWYLCHRIRAAMAAVPPQPLLHGTVEVGETYVGGRERGMGSKRNKEIVIGIRQRGGELRFFHAEDAKSGTLAKYIRENISTDAVDVVMTDELPAYPKAMIAAGVHGDKHKTIRHRDRVYVRGDIHTNTVESAFSLLKRGIMGTWHRVSAKHLEAYLNEMCFRFNNRKNPFLFRDTLKRMLNSENLEFKELIAA